MSRSQPKSEKLPPTEDPFQKLREQMVREQVEGRGIRDPRLLSILKLIPRHRFLPEKDWDRAYSDAPLSIGHEATISQPYIVGAMTEMLGLQGVEKVLEIGTGSGYQTAVLAELAGEVYSLDIVPELTAHAKTVLDSLGYRNVHLRVGDGSKGWPEVAPFDAILVTAAPETVPTTLLEQLNEGGRLVIPIGKQKQHLYLFKKNSGAVREEKKFEVRFVPLI